MNESNSSTGPFDLAWAMVKKEVRGEVGTDSNRWKVPEKKASQSNQTAKKASSDRGHSKP